MNMGNIISIKPMEFPWATQDPFLFCAHHADAYPKGNEKLGPDVSLEGRDIGQDFTIKDGWRMYHGDKVPGFPSHPHRGFETITLATTGLVDHSDSMGAKGRFGEGDVQWMTAGSGIQHSEMFPLLSKEKENPLEIFQVWLNLPRSSKMVDPHYKMLWHEDIPIVSEKDQSGHVSEIRVVSGDFKNTKALKPTPNSWAANPENDVSIWTIKMESGAELTLPSTEFEVNRTLYFHRGQELFIDGERISNYHSIQVNPHSEINLKAGEQDCYILMLQGKPLNEPVVQYGPFVMNTEAEIRQTMKDYQETQFGGWPWESNDPVHGSEKRRFAYHSDGRKEERG